MDRMSMEEVIALLQEPPTIERAVRYVTQRGRRAYKPMGGRPAEELMDHVKEHTRLCFCCGEKRPEYLGTCWGNFNCEIWVCQKCAPTVQTAVEEATVA